MRQETLTPFDVHVHPRTDGGFDLLASAGHAGSLGQASETVTSSVVAPLEQIRRELDEDDHQPFEAQRHHDHGWRRVNGGNVFRALLPDAVQRLYRTSLRHARRQGLCLALRIRYSETTDRQLHEMPWELVFDPDEEQFLALWPETCLARYVLMPAAERAIRRGSCTLLLTKALSDARPLEKGDDECARIGAVTRKTIRPTSSTVTSGSQIRSQLTAAAQAGLPYLAWHHVGHGALSEKTGQFALTFDRNGRDVDETSLTDLVSAVAQSRVRCAVLNICYSGRSAGLATTLASANVPIVIGHRTKVFDQAAISFAATLWRELAAGQPAELAIRMARMAILSQGWGGHWIQPMLFVRTDNTQLVEESA
jgi:hypothetical protein